MIGMLNLFSHIAIGTTGSSPDPNQYLYNNSPSLGSSSPYHSGMSEGHLWPNQQCSELPMMASSELAWGRSPAAYYSPQITEIGGSPVYPPHEMLAE